MKFSLSWLKAFLETDADLAAITDRLTAIGLEVEAVDKGDKYRGFVIAKAIAAEKHPNADKLQVLKVDIGAGAPVQVVCGAPNARAGLVGVFAPAGTYIPGLDTVLSVGKIRDVESFGMLCSERELLLSDAHDGIIDLGEAALTSGKAKIGGSFAAWRGLDDPIIDVGLTPNRADCASVYGIARDLAAAGIGRLKPLPMPALKRPKTLKPLPLKVEDAENCRGFAAYRLDGVENRPSPDWLQSRLRSAGLSPKNALVDITNYFTLAYGRPLHVFDADKLRGTLRVRAARKGEELAALNGKTYALPSGACVIADDSGAVSLAGIIGGAAAGCDEKTKAVIVESACWNPRGIARIGRDLGIVSDARYRFERGVDPQFMLPGLELAAAQILELCGGKQTKITAFAVEENEAPPAREITFPLSEIKRLTGLEVPASETKAILQRLGFALLPAKGKSFAALRAAVPSWRMDIEGKADLVEEVLRIYGIDKITPQPLPPLAAERILPPARSRSFAARRALAARGMSEAVTYAFIAEKAASLFGGGAAELKLANPIAANMSDMRPSLLPNLLAAAKRNSDRGFGSAALFETADIYQSAEAAGQRRAVAGLRAGTAGLAGAGRLWRGNAGAVDCFDAKADALAVLEALGLAADKAQIERGAPAWHHPGRSGVIKLGPKTILGYFGEFHPDILEYFDFSPAEKPALCGFELFLDAVPEARKKAVKAKPPLALSPFQPLQRDFSFIVDEEVPAAAILRAAAGADKKLIAECRIFDVFRDEALGAGKKAVGLQVTIQPQTASMTDEELEALSAGLIDNVLKATGGSLR